MSNIYLHHSSFVSIRKDRRRSLLDCDCESCEDRVWDMVCDEGGRRTSLLCPRANFGIPTNLTREVTAMEGECRGERWEMRERVNIFERAILA